MVYFPDDVFKIIISYLPKRQMHPCAKMIDKYILQVFFNNKPGFYNHLNLPLSPIFSWINWYKNIYHNTMYDKLFTNCHCCQKKYIYPNLNHLNTKMHIKNYQKNKPTLENIRNSKKRKNYKIWI